MDLRLGLEILIILEDLQEVCFYMLEENVAMGENFEWNVLRENNVKIASLVNYTHKYFFALLTERNNYLVTSSAHTQILISNALLPDEEPDVLGEITNFRTEAGSIQDEPELPHNAEKQESARNKNKHNNVTGTQEKPTEGTQSGRSPEQSKQQNRGSSIELTPQV